MLSKDHRFHGLGSLNRVYKNGETVRSPYCAMKFIRGHQEYKVAVVVSKKVAKSAPARNRIRRRIFEAIRLNSNLLNNQEIVVTIFDDRFLSMPYKQLEDSIRRQLKEIAQKTK